MKTIKTIFVLLLIAITLGGCIIVINQPSPEEKQLLSIQQEVGSQVKALNQQIAQANFNPSSINSYLDAGLKAIQDGIRQIDSLKIPEKVQKVAVDIKKRLEDLKRNYEQLKIVFSDIEKLKQKGTELTAQAQIEINKQIKNLQGTVKEVTNYLSRSVSYLEDLGNQIMAQYNQKK